MTGYGNRNPANFLRGLQIPVKPKVFVSYHHAKDQFYADRFVSLFHDQYQVITDRSLDDSIESDDSDYIYQRIRDEFISGTSCTIVLCGAETMNRKHVDWEIKATLDKGHGLLGTALPNARRDQNGIFVPDRLHTNIQSGYARWMQWTESPHEMLAAINAAREQAKQTSLIRNSSPMMGRNR